jgi:hypothetical protein
MSICGFRLSHLDFLHFERRDCLPCLSGPTYFGGYVAEPYAPPRIVPQVDPGGYVLCTASNYKTT